MNSKLSLERLGLWSGLLQGLGVITGWFTGYGCIISSIIALCAALWLVIRMLTRKCILLSRSEIVRGIIAEIDDVRSAYLASKYKGEWPSKYSRLLKNLSPVTGSFLNKVIMPDVAKAVARGAVWMHEDGNGKNDECLKTAFEGALCMFSGRKALQAVRSWRVSGRVRTAPARGIDAYVDPLFRDQIAKRMVERFRLWLNSARRENTVISVLLIGANDQKLSKLVIEGMRDLKECGGLNLYIRGTANDHEMFIRNFFGKDDNSANHDKVRVQLSEIGQYDVAIVTHYYQHHDFNHYNTLKMPVVEGGLLLWLSAISRALKFDEYVCEGCMPKRAVVYEQGGREYIPFASMKLLGRKIYIRYEPFEEFSKNPNHEPILAMGFPKKFIVETKIFEEDRAGVVMDYLKWEQGNGLADLLQKSELYRNSPKQQEMPEILGVKILHIKQEDSGQHEYSILTIKYCAAGRERILHFIVTTGPEANEWNGRGIRQQSCLVTLNPALYFDCRGSVCGDWEQVSGLLKEVVEELYKGDRDKIDRYLKAINVETIKVYDNDIAVCELKTDIRDPDLNHILMFFANCGDNRGDARCYYSYLPKRRYLTPAEYGAEYEFMEEFKRSVDSLDATEKARFLPVLSHSVTWLRSFANIKDFLSGEGFTVEDGMNGLPDGCFFHKCLGDVNYEELDTIASKERFVLSDELCKQLGKKDDEIKKHSVGKDEAFNKLPMAMRIMLIPSMNVHDVLISAIKVDGLQQNKLKPLVTGTRSWLVSRLRRFFRIISALKSVRNTANREHVHVD